LPKFLIRLRKWAETKGVEFCYNTSFQDFIFDEKKCIVGAVVKHNDKDVEIRTRLVVDCSGIPSVARRKLPNECTVENFEISPRDMFYVILRYVILDNPEKDKIDHTIS
jgi:flavin-dependent dehydrogenase